MGAGLTSVQGRGAVQVPPHKTRLRLFPDRVVPHPPDPALGGQWWGWDPQNAPKTTPEPPWTPPEYPRSPHPEVSPQPAPIAWWGLREFLGPGGFGGTREDPGVPQVGLGGYGGGPLAPGGRFGCVRGDLWVRRDLRVLWGGSPPGCGVGLGAQRWVWGSRGLWVFLGWSQPGCCCSTGGEFGGVIWGGCEGLGGSGGSEVSGVCVGLTGRTGVIDSWHHLVDRQE